MKRIETLLVNNFLYCYRHLRPSQNGRTRKVFVQMQRTVYIISFLLSALLLQAQSPSREQLIGTWIGVHAEWEADFFCPLPTYLRLEPDGAYQLGMVDNSAQPLVSTWAVQGDTVRLDTVHYAPRLVSLQGGLLRIGTLYPMVFRKFSAIPVDSANTYQQLNGRVWQSNNLTISFYSNGQVSVENTATKKKTVHFWQVVRFGSSVFLVIRGNQHNKDGDFKPLWQIANLNANQMQAIGWNGCTVTTETFRLIRDIPAGEVCHPTDFQPCSNCFSQTWNSRSVSNPSKRYDLIQLITNYYQPVQQIGQSGLIRVRFVLNCEGEQGPFELSGFGEDYCPKLFDRRITDQLRDICQNRVGTDPTLRQSQPTDPPHDVSLVVTFRLKDGRVTDILP
ncbi:hypothetical protein [Spirosoma radiotolerans]|uniref:hypothetical protein n=1 Tax=Spirosoma radiotolerans TaxID=1379870 RepID=UPI000AD23AAB|nr:hypothetical protein [Spirosoma radiotolerans]